MILIYRLIYSRITSYFQYFIVSIFALYAYKFSYSKIMVRFLTSAAFSGVAFIIVQRERERERVRGSTLIRGNAVG